MVHLVYEDCLVIKVFFLHPFCRSDIMEKVVKSVIPAKYLDEDTKYHINPCGNFVIGKL